jgi:hypothetical protein
MEEKPSLTLSTKDLEDVNVSTAAYNHIDHLSMEQKWVLVDLYFDYIIHTKINKNFNEWILSLSHDEIDNIIIAESLK